MLFRSEHKRIIFNGDGYASEWVTEAEKRGLLNLKTTSDAMPHFLDKKNVDLFIKFKVHTKAEMEARYEIQMEEYGKVLNIEARTMINMVNKDILPCVFEYEKEVAASVCQVKGLLASSSCKAQEELVKEMVSLSDKLYDNTKVLIKIADEAQNFTDVSKVAKFYTSEVIPAMNQVREVADKLEVLVGKEYWPFPTYEDLLFRV